MQKDLVNRLRGIYTTPVNDGAGLLDGKDTFTRTFQTPPIQHEAANRIEELEGALLEVYTWLQNYDSLAERIETLLGA